MVDIAIDQRELDARGLIKTVKELEEQGYYVWLNQNPLPDVSFEHAVLARFAEKPSVSLVRFIGTAQLKDIFEELVKDSETGAQRRSLTMISTRTDAPGLPRAFRLLTSEGLEKAKKNPAERTLTPEDLEALETDQAETFNLPVVISDIGDSSITSIRSFNSIVNDFSGLVIAVGAFVAALLILSLTLFNFDNPNTQPSPLAGAQETAVTADAGPLAQETVIDAQDEGMPPAEVAEAEVPAPTTAVLDQPEQRTERKVQKDSNVRSGPGLEFAIIAGVKPGQSITVIGEPDPTGWALIEMATGQRGYVFTPLLSVPEEEGDTAGLIRDCEVCPELVMLSAGSFSMGSSVGEPSRRSDEGPVHTARIETPILVAKYEVTFEDWQACLADGGCNGYEPSDAGWGQGRRPAIHVNWNDAQAYVEWLQQKTGKAYRLLSEAEWEYAARAGTQSAYSFGDTINPDQAVMNGQAVSRLSAGGVKAEQTEDVGSRPANAFKLYDFHGNVGEWVADCWNQDYMGAPADASVRPSGDCARRVVRGGSWRDGPAAVRSAARSSAPAEIRADTIGFRVMRTL